MEESRGLTYESVMPGDLLTSFKNVDIQSKDKRSDIIKKYKALIDKKFTPINNTGETNQYIAASCNYWNALHDTCMQTLDDLSEQITNTPSMDSMISTKISQRVGAVPFPIYHSSLIVPITRNIQQNGSFYKDISPLIDYLNTIFPNNTYNKSCNTLMKKIHSALKEALTQAVKAMQSEDGRNPEKPSSKNNMKGQLIKMIDTLPEGIPEAIQEVAKQFMPLIQGSMGKQIQGAMGKQIQGAPQQIQGGIDIRNIPDKFEMPDQMYMQQQMDLPQQM